jgi:DNA repair protein RadC
MTATTPAISLPAGGPDHPTSRLIALGTASLTNTELLSILLANASTRTAPVTEVAPILTAVGGSLRRLASDFATTLQALGHVRDRRVARRHSVTLHAAFELGRRRAAEALPAKVRLTAPAAVMDYVADRMRDLPFEEFHTLALDAHLFLEHDITVTRGLLSSAPVDARAAFRQAIAERAAEIIFVHNHPSGDPTPSPEDRVITAQLSFSGRILGVPVRDHVIIGDSRYFSFAEAGEL